MMNSGEGRTFVLNQKIMSASGDLWIEDERGTPAFQVDGRAFSVRRRHALLDASGRVLYEISQELAHINRTFVIRRNGQPVATIKQSLLTLLGDRFTVDLVDGGELAVQGDFIDREFRITRDGADVIFASRRLLSIRDKYGVQVAPGFDVPLALAIVVALEQMELQAREASARSMHH
jgi:uncharacterized protein YxjI